MPLRLKRSQHVSWLRWLLLLSVLAAWCSRFRVRTAYLTTLGLANYSEFGLIVAAVSVSTGWINNQWLLIIALSLSLTFSFVIGSIVNSRAHGLYTVIEVFLHRFEIKQRLPVDISPDLGDAEILIAGMGRVGAGAYISMNEIFGDKVCGIDADVDSVTWHQRAGRKVILGDAENIDFWHEVDIDKLQLVMLAMPTTADMYQAVKLLNASGYKGMISAVVKYEDDRAKLEAVGVHATFNFYAEAGSGFAQHVLRKLEQNGRSLISNSAIS